MDDTELLREFAVESQEHLADIENQLLTIESQGDAMDVSLVNTVFRAIHSIKGAAGFMGLDTLGGLAHRAEEVLGRLRSHELRPTSVVINTLLRATDRLKELIDEVECSNGQDVSKHIVDLEKILAGELDAEESGSPIIVGGHEIAGNPTTPPNASAKADSSINDILQLCFDCLEQIEHDLSVLDRNSDDRNAVENAFGKLQELNAVADDLGFSQISKIACAGGKLLAGIHTGTFPMDPQISESLGGAIKVLKKTFQAIQADGTEGDEDHQFTVDFLEAVLSVKVPRNSTSPSTTSDKSPPPVKSLAASPAETKRAERSVSVETAPTDQAGSATKEAKTELAKSPSHDSGADTTIRVDVALLDKLMTRVGELVLARNQILQFQSKIEEPGLQKAIQRLNQITSELQEGVMKTRMQPIGNVWTKFPRLVRDLASMCEKQVRIEMEGKETELDKTIIEAIKDPLTHLVRNTVDHGIEKPEVRRKAGKPVEGCLTLRAFHEGGEVNIEIVDDGGGLNFERIKAKALEKGLISSEEAASMPEREIGNLIFLPGFSTAEKVSSVSGRGVGMDVVRTNIEKIGGSVDLQSRTGLGTTIKIKIPLTLAIVPALVVAASGDRYAIPQVNLLELVRLENQIAKPSIEWIQGSPVYRLRGRLLPIVSLRTQLGECSIEEIRRSNSLNIVVLKAEDRQLGLIVDRILDSEEIVVKPLGKHLKNIPLYSGTTIMGDGRVALILDVVGLAHAAKILTKNKDRGATDSATSSELRRANERSLLVFAVGEHGRAALPLDQVTRLEKLSRHLVEQSHHREVIQYRGEIMPLLRLSGHLGQPDGANWSELMDVVVYTHQNRSVGVVVDQILDIAACRFEANTDGNIGSLGSSTPPSIVIDGHVTDVLDLPTLVASALA
ncbi:MAG: chemotaxis protein CheW [Planctomycetaceae bacterium]|nr:chemotaxis protein CheW [Planctomycetaceae bacterium]